MRISFDNTDRALRLGMPIDAAKAEFIDFGYDEIHDEEMRRSYLIFHKKGFDLEFRENQLTGVFIYLTPNRDQRPAFDGELDYLPHDFFAEPSAQRFVDLVASQGFEASKRKYSHATDMLDANVRLRFQEGPTGLMVCIDDGAMIR